MLSFESRRATEMAQLIQINQGMPTVAPAMREIPIEENRDAFAFADRLYGGAFEMVILMTGVGTRYLQKVLATRESEGRFAEALRSVTVVVRGPKPASVMREWNVPVAVSVPEPNTWREVLAAITERPEKKVAVQEYGRPNPNLIEGLCAQGREVTAVPVYQWALPEDTQPLQQAIQGLLQGRFKAVLFTTGVQIDHLLSVAETVASRQEVIRALQSTMVASIGPDCSETLRSYGIIPALEPSHPKMGLLVREAALAHGDQAGN